MLKNKFKIPFLFSFLLFGNIFLVSKTMAMLSDEELVKKTSYLKISTIKKTSESSSEDEENNTLKKTPESSNEDEKSSEDEEDIVSFLTVGQGKYSDTIAINGLDCRRVGSYRSAMIEKMDKKVYKYIQKGWGKNQFNKYNGFSFSNCNFDKDLLESVGEKLSCYATTINPSTHFYNCNFDKKRLRSVLVKTAGFSKKSTFLNSQENGESIPNTSSRSPKK